jgi:uncharacterized membrane protein
MAMSFLLPKTDRKPLTSDTYEKALAFAAVVLLVAATTAVIKGRNQWEQLPLALWGHLATIGTALILTPVMMLRKRGDPLHRQIGWVWVVAMFGTALVTLDLRMVNGDGLSVIHILSIWTLIQVPLIVWHARHHNIPRHRSAVRGMVTGALLIAGFFTFPFNRLLGRWLFG